MCSGLMRFTICQEEDSDTEEEGKGAGAGPAPAHRESVGWLLSLPEDTTCSARTSATGLCFSPDRASIYGADRASMYGGGRAGGAVSHDGSVAEGLHGVGGRSHGRSGPGHGAAPELGRVSSSGRAPHVRTGGGRDMACSAPASTTIHRPPSMLPAYAQLPHITASSVFVSVDE